MVDYFTSFTSRFNIKKTVWLKIISNHAWVCYDKEKKIVGKTVLDLELCKKLTALLYVDLT